MLCIVAIVDCTITPCGPQSEHATSYCHCRLHPYSVSRQLPSGLDSIAQENPTTDILVEEQQIPPLDMVAVDQERELHKPNS